jgi:hypothetical protein
MNRVRGFLSAEIIGYIAVVLAIIALIAGAVFYVRHVESTAFEAGKTAGVSEEKGRWQTRENEELTAANERIHDLEEEKRALERKSVDDVQAAAIKLDQATKEKDDEKERALAAAHAGRAFGMRWQPTASPSKEAAGSAGAAPGTAAAGTVAATYCELPEQQRDDLIREAARADKVVLERNALLEIAQKDREVCK